MQLSSYDLSAASSTVLTNCPNFPNSLGPVAFDRSRKLVIGINFAATRTVPDTLDLYDVANFNSPLLIASYPFPNNSRTNGNFIGQGVIAGNRVFAVDGNNGIAAFTLLAPGGPPITIDRSGTDVVIAWPAAAGYVLQKTVSLSAPSWTDVATPVVPASDQNTVTESAASGDAFYRLHKAN